MGDAEPIIATVVPRIADIDACDWDACANPGVSTFNPFLSHAFLLALEDSGTVGTGTGWMAQHLVMRDEAGQLAGCMPLYIKMHSQGEYVFDHTWAEALHRAGGRYYPKLLGAVPFTPVPGRRLLVRPGPQAEACEMLLARAGVALAKKLGCSSLHINFLTEGEARLLAACGFLLRTDQQFHWSNPGYRTFEEFLETLSSRKRKAIRKERAEVAAAGLEIEHVTGAAIRDQHWDAMFQFYMDTGSRKWGRPYLNRRFFSLLGASLANRCLLVLVRRNGRYIAGALNLIGGDCLYGRYWGATESVRSLHFEVCYYQAIEYAITLHLARVEAGAQGEHKLARGYLPVTTYSAHWLAEPRLHQAVAQYLERERAEVHEISAFLTAACPYRKPNS
jgi:hypothetical protein